MSLNKSKPYASIFGHASAHFEQGGLLYDASGELLGTPPTVAKSLSESDIVLTDALVSAKAFLANILSTGALSKAAVYKAAEGNNQPWDIVKDASIEMKVMKFQYQKSETWKLSEVPE